MLWRSDSLPELYSIIENTFVVASESMYSSISGIGHESLRVREFRRR